MKMVKVKRSKEAKKKVGEKLDKLLKGELKPDYSVKKATQKTTKAQAKYLSDKATLERGETLKIYNAQDYRLTHDQLLMLKINPKNFQRWKNERGDKTPTEAVEDRFTKNITFFFDMRDLADKFLQIHPCYYDKARNWWIWDYINRKWIMSDETDILNALSRQAQCNTISSKDKNEIMEALKQESRKNPPINIKPTWIQFKDKIFDIKTGDQFEATSQHFVTNPIPWSLHKDKFEETPVMDKIFEEWVGKDHVKTLYEIIAYCLLPDYPIHRLFCFHGSGMNGKSCFLELLKRFIGADNCCSTELDTLLGSRFEVTRLYKKLVCQMGETNFNEMSRTSMLKKLTGGDLIGFEYKNKDHFNDKNYAKILISTNNLPTTTDKTIGFYRRWCIIDFPNQFSEKKDILNDIPDEEYEALALKCTGILHDLLIKREFHKEGTVQDRMDRYEAKSDFLQKFLNDFTDHEVNSYITKADFYKKFNGWCKENRHREMSETSLGLTMKRKGIESEKKYADWLFDGKGRQIRVWVGIGWKDI